MRTSRTNGSKTYKYYYNGSQLTAMDYNGTMCYFTYDANGSPICMWVNNVKYYYVTNLQGDVVALLNYDGRVLVEYTYDAWGNALTRTGTLANSVGLWNPLRYRGYVYDQETKLYYLQSRYYNPEIGRFINGDAFTATGQGLLGNNMFAYCGNNPTSRNDNTGMFWNKVGSFLKKAVKTVVTAVVVAIAYGTTPSILVEKKTHYNRNERNSSKIETIDQVPSDWTTSNTEKYPKRKSGAAANAHQNTAPSKDKPNTKFSSPDKHEEVIFSFDEVLVVDPSDIGTYNFGTNFITHWCFDVVPWIKWGNTPDDPTTVWGRAEGLVWGTNK